MKFTEKTSNYLSSRTVYNTRKGISWVYGMNLRQDQEDHITSKVNQMTKSSKIYFVAQKIVEKFPEDQFNLWSSFNELITEKLCGSYCFLLASDNAFLIDLTWKNDRLNFSCAFITNGCCINRYMEGFFNEDKSQEIGCYVPSRTYKLPNQTTFDSIDNYYFDMKDAEILEFAMRCLVFMKYAPIITTKVAKGYGRKNLNGVKYKSDFANEVTVVDSNWFTTIIREEGFGVRGHFRLQPCGKGNKDRKLVWIDAFKKNGYKREAKKLNH